jgi:hypothetical protein
VPQNIQLFIIGSQIIFIVIIINIVFQMYKHFLYWPHIYRPAIGMLLNLCYAMPLTIKLSNSAFEFCAKANEVLNNKRIK